MTFWDAGARLKRPPVWCFSGAPCVGFLDAGCSNCEQPSLKRALRNAVELILVDVLLRSIRRFGGCGSDIDHIRK